MQTIFPHLYTSTFDSWMLLWVGLFFCVALSLLFLTHRGQIESALASKVGQILIGWLIIIPFYTVGIFADRDLAIGLVFLVLGLALYEVCELIKLPRIYTLSLYGLTLVTLIIATYFPEHYLGLPLLYFLIITALPVRMNDVEQGLSRVAASMFVMIWIVFFGGHIILLGHLDFAYGLDRALLGGIILAVSLSDIGAYVVGKLCSGLAWAERTRIAPAITPNKHWLGLIGHIGGAALGLAVAYPFLSHTFSFLDISFLAAAIGFFGLLGGLLNSLLKRTYRVKDSGSSLPGHGGVLDRIDSLVRVAGTSYYFILFLLP